MMSNRIRQNLRDQVGPAESCLKKEEGYRWAVVIPVRNRADQLKKCLESLRKQEFLGGQWEVLICDDGSTEDLSAVVQRFKSSLPYLRLLRQQCKGPAAARNLGLRSTDADIIVLLDSDVICKKDFLRKIVEALYIHLNWAGAEARILPEGKKNGPLWQAPICHKGGRYHTAAIAYRRAALLQAGGFDEVFKLPACEDVELASRVLQLGPIGFVPEAVAYHPTRCAHLRIHWQWRKHWKYELILAKRHGFLAFPDNRVGRFPRLRLALAAVLTLPVGRFLLGCAHLPKSKKEGLLACFYSLFDVICGIYALPDILWGEVPLVKNYLQSLGDESG